MNQLPLHSISAVNFIKFVRRIINSTCLVFISYDSNGKSRISKIRLFIAICIMLLSFYHTFNDILYTILYADRELVMAVTFSCSSLQSSLSIVFVIYWQLRGQLHKLLNEIKWSQFQVYDHKSRFILKACYSGMFLLSICSFFNAFSLIYTCYFDNSLAGDFKMSFFNLYGGIKFAFIVAIINFYYICICSIVMIFYCIISWVTYKEIDALNSSIKQIGDTDQNDKSKIADKLLGLYDRQITLSDIIDEIDSTFEVYSFSMLGSIIPTTVFALVSIIKGIKNSVYYSTGLIILGVLFWVVEIIVLTYGPSKIHASVRSIEKTIFTCRFLWFPYDQRLYEISRMFAAHVTQSSIGVSLWGFTLIKKSLILTTASLTATYLVLLLEVDKGQNSSNTPLTLNCTN